MGRKKKKPIKPWCWYCNREFDDDKILIQHQRAKHYKCPFCHKKLYSGPGLTVHCIQVHKEKLDKIPEALPNKNSVDIDIYGMQGVPEEDQRERERAKRGDDGPSKLESETKNQQPGKSNSIPPASVAPVMPPNPLQAAMFQQSMGRNLMPPGFPILPMGMPPMFPPGFMPPPGFPGASLNPPHMMPGMPMHGQGFGMPPMIPPSTMGGGGTSLPPPPIHLNFPPPPPSPPPPPPSNQPHQESHSSKMSQLPLLPPPPMSGVGHLIGIPPPSFKPNQVPVSRESDKTNIESSTRNDKNQQSQVNRSQSPPKQKSESDPKTSTTRNSAILIAKPAIITSSDTTTAARSTCESEDFIDVPSLNARIMHPNKELSLEEIRLSLSRYNKKQKYDDSQVDGAVKEDIKA